jgi:hypothetical protein
MSCITRTSVLALWRKCALALILLGTSVSAMADTYVAGQVLFSGKNVYGASILNDGGYHMWHSAWQVSSIPQQDIIYYRKSADNINWSSPTTVYRTTDLEASYPGITGKVTHVTDPSVTKHTNGVTGEVQYTMFFTVCMSKVAGSTCDAQKDNEIWSVVSNDGGKNWVLPKPLISGIPNVYASEPSAIIDQQSDGTFWKVYYDDRADSTKVRLVGVDGNRNVIRHYAPAISTTITLANPEVRYFNGQWHLFANVYGPGARDASGTMYPTTANIYKVSSPDNTNFPATAARPIIVNGGVPYCGTIAPGIQPVGGNQYDIYFGLISNSVPGQGCDMAANTYMVRYRFAE